MFRHIKFIFLRWSILLSIVDVCVLYASVASFDEYDEIRLWFLGSEYQMSELFSFALAVLLPIALWAGIDVMRITRRYDRALWGVCLECGYDWNHTDAPDCPECGRNKTLGITA